MFRWRNNIDSIEENPCGPNPAGKLACEANNLEMSNFRKWCLRNKDNKIASIASGAAGSVLSTGISSVAVDVSARSSKNHFNLL